jgi:nicotinate-nucleotide pyrophosphorylase (carboxylating)
MVEPIVRATLLEDLGQAGDITSDAINPADVTAGLALTARQAGIVAGLDIATLALRLVDPSIEVTPCRRDGSKVEPGEMIATVRGSARGLLGAEHTALNSLCHLSGIATATASMHTARQHVTR